MCRLLDGYLDVVVRQTRFPRYKPELPRGCAFFLPRLNKAARETGRDELDRLRNCQASPSYGYSIATVPVRAFRVLPLICGRLRRLRQAESVKMVHGVLLACTR